MTARSTRNAMPRYTVAHIDVPVSVPHGLLLVLTTAATYHAAALRVDDAATWLLRQAVNTQQPLTADEVEAAVTAARAILDNVTGAEGMGAGR